MIKYSKANGCELHDGKQPAFHLLLVLRECDLAVSFQVIRNLPHFRGILVTENNHGAGTRSEEDIKFQPTAA